MAASTPEPAVQGIMGYCSKPPPALLLAVFVSRTCLRARSLRNRCTLTDCTHSIYIYMCIYIYIYLYQIVLSTSWLVFVLTLIDFIFPDRDFNTLPSPFSDCDFNTLSETFVIIFSVVTRVVRRSTFGTNAIPRQGRESERKEGGGGGGGKGERERKKECV